MTLFVDGAIPTAQDMERLRLLLSTYQDGSGMLDGGKAPGWRDFERVAASWLSGSAPESKHIYDVHVRREDGLVHGFSCKMRGTLGDTRRTGLATIEVTNADSELWEGVQLDTGITRGSILGCNPERARDAGIALVRTIRAWHHTVCHTQGGTFLSAQSPMLHLAWQGKSATRPRTKYRLYVFNHHLPTHDEMDTMEWTVNGSRLLGQRVVVGEDKQEQRVKCIEWYFSSGGQVKYYPPVADAIYASEEFELEPLDAVEDDLLAARAFAYWPEKWGAATNMDRDTVEAVAEALEGLQ